MTEVIDLNSVLPIGTSFQDFFDSESAYEEFKERYRREVRPKLKENEEDRRRSEEDARHLFLV